MGEAKASDLFVRALENEGVEFVFGLPGEENLDLLDSLSRSNIKLILVRHEQGAGFMAATYGRLTGKVGVCLATLGPGATNLVTPAAYAQLGAMPMLMITGQKPIKSSAQGLFQIVDIVDTMRPLTKYTHQIVSASSIPFVIRDAFRIALDERPGAVHIELPEDIAEEMTDAEPTQVLPTSLPEASAESIELAAAMIEASRRPLLLFGAASNRRRVHPALAHFVDATGIPFFTTQMGKGVVDERHELCIGTAALSSGDYIHNAERNADLIINVGYDVVEKPPFVMKRGGTRVIHINFLPAVVDEIYFPQLEVVGDIRRSMTRLADRLGRVDHEFDYCGKLRAAINRQINEGSRDSRFPMIPQRIVADVRQVMPSDGIIALDNGIYKIWFARNYAAHTSNSVLLDNALATMGAGLPSAMLASALHRDRRVMAVCGDGGFMMNSQELETAVRYGLNLVVLILRDDAYGMIRWKQAARGMTDFGLQFGNPDFVTYAQSYGARGHRVASADEFVTVLEAAFSAGGVHLVDTPVDYSENERVLITELREKASNLTL